MAKTVIKTNIEYGKEYKDKITGFVGTAVAISKWKNGCLRIGLMPKCEKNKNKIEDAVWFDEPDLITPIEEDPGGPRQNPKRNPDPSY